MLTQSHPVDIGASGFLSQHNRPVSHTRQTQFHSHPQGFVSSQTYSSRLNSSTNLPRRTSVQGNYCKKLGHTIDKCYKLQRIKGQPDRGRRMVATSVQQSENTPVVTDSAAIVPSGHHTLATEEYAKVLALLGKQDMDVTHNLDTPHNSYLAGKPFCLLTSFNDTNWITMPNGRQARVHHIGTIVLSKDIILKDVFHVPDFHFNLLSASKIAKHLSSYVIFSPNLCFIQDPLKNRQVVLGKERGGLYFVNTSEQFTGQVASL